MAEIPIKLDWLKPFDTDPNGSLSTEELQFVPVDDIALNVAFLEADQRQGVFEAVAPLPTFKLARIFDGETTDDFWKGMFERLAKDDPAKAADVLIKLKESPFKSDSSGLSAHILLDNLDVELRSELMTKIKKIDLQYHDDILAVSTRASGMDMAEMMKGPDPTRSDQYPKPISIELLKTDDPADALYAEQHEYVISNPGHARFIQTAGAFPCVIMVLYDPSSKIGVLTHLDGSLKLEDSIDIMLHDMESQGADISKVRASLYGGEVSSEESPQTIYRLRRYLEARNVAIAEQDILPKPGMRGTAITFDLETGQAFRYEENYNGLDVQLVQSNSERALRYCKYNLVTRREPTSFGEAPFVGDPQAARADYLDRVKGGNWRIDSGSNVFDRFPSIDFDRIPPAKSDDTPY